MNFADVCQRTGISNLHELQKYSVQNLKNRLKNVNVYYQRLLTFVIFS